MPGAPNREDQQPETQQSDILEGLVASRQSEVEVARPQRRLEVGSQRSEQTRAYPWSDTGSRQKSRSTDLSIPPGCLLRADTGAEVEVPLTSLDARLLSLILGMLTCKWP